MAHLSDWHDFNPADRATYPKVDAPVQVKFNNGRMEEGGSRTYFPQVRLLPASSIEAWRYIQGVSQRERCTNHPTSSQLTSVLRVPLRCGRMLTWQRS